MFCGQCGTNNAPGTHFCGNCGAGLAQAPPAPIPTPPPVQGQVPAGYVAQPGGYGAPRRTGSASIDFRRLGTGDLVALGATILLLVSIFLTWYSALAEDQFGDIVSLRENIFGQFAGGFRILILVTCILIILYLFIRTMTPRGLRLPMPHWQVLTILTALQALLTVLAFFLKPGAGSGVSVSWSYGAYIGLPAAVIALAGSAMRSREPEVIVPGAPRSGFGSGFGGGGYGTPPYGVEPSYGTPAAPPQQAPMLQCVHCGTAVAVGAPYCTNCGAPTAS